MKYDFIVVGGGLVGLATALQLQSMHKGRRVVLLEKEAAIGQHQSTHNSGVLHCGLYYKPGSLKARMAVEGIKEMVRFCRTHNVPHEICGKVVVATDQAEDVRLDELLRRGAANGLEGLRKLDRAGMRAIEPCVGGVSAAFVPQEGIVDYRAVCDAMANLIRGQDGEIRTGAKVVQLEHRPEGWLATTAAGTVGGRFLVNCAGLHSDRMAALAGEKQDLQIVPFRGEYYELTDEARGMVRNLIYPVPDPAFPFLGTHFTRLIQGEVECGPNAVLAFAREGYRMRTVNPRDLAETLLYPGLWRFLRRYPAMAWDEVVKSFSRKAFCRSLQKLVPDIREHHLRAGGAGVRAQAMTRGGELVQDFQLIRRPAALHVLNAPSPAATASLAIGAHIAREIGAGV